jgi:hypothetical protein
VSGAYLAPGFQHRLVDVMSPHTLAAETRQQGGVDVHHAVLVASWYFPETEPAALDDEIDLCGDKFLFDALAEFIDVGVVFLANDFHVQSGVFSFGDSAGLRQRAYNNRHFGIELSLLDVFEDVYERGASTADQHAESNRFASVSAALGLDFNIVACIQGLINEFVGLDVVFPANVPNLPAIEPAQQAHGLLVKRSNQLALDLVLAVDLPDEQFAVTENNKLSGTDSRCGLEGFDQAGVFGYIVRGSAQRQAFCL